MRPLFTRRRAWLLAAVSLCALPALSLRAAAYDPLTVASPGGAITATVDSHTYELTVNRGGREVLSTPLGGAESTAPQVAQDTVRDAYSTPAGKRHNHTLVARRLRLTWPDGHGIELLVADDGVA